MDDLLRMGGSSAEDDWPELEPERRNDRADDPDADPNVTDDDEKRPGVPASDPESEVVDLAIGEGGRLAFELIRVILIHQYAAIMKPKAHQALIKTEILQHPLPRCTILNAPL